jgi:hypothetical protein
MEARGRPGSNVVQEAGRQTGCSKDGRFGEGDEKMTWHGGTHELGRRIGKLPEQIVF